MHWLQLEVQIGSADAEALGEALQAMGALSVDYLAAGDSNVLEPAPGETPLWPELRLRALFDPARVAEDELRLAVAATLGAGRQADLQFRRIEERDWLGAFRASLQPLRVGEGLWICPSGTRCPEPGGIALRLDPGLAFGSGEHPTTAMCLEWLAEGPTPGRMLDYGCGSGILALAAAALGAAEVVAVDRDPQALAATTANAGANDIDCIRACRPEALPAALRFDTVVANILSDALIELAPLLCGRLAPGGRLALSGVLASQAEALQAAYAPWIELSERRQRNDWILLAGFMRD